MSIEVPVECAGTEWHLWSIRKRILQQLQWRNATTISTMNYSTHRWIKWIKWIKRIKVDVACGKALPPPSRPGRKAFPMSKIGLENGQLVELVLFFMGAKSPISLLIETSKWNMRFLGRFFMAFLGCVDSILPINRQPLLFMYANSTCLLFTVASITWHWSPLDALFHSWPFLQISCHLMVIRSYKWSISAIANEMQMKCKWEAEPLNIFRSK